MYRRTKEERINSQRAALQEAEEQGIVADSMDVRKELVRRIQSGELTLDEAQAELTRIKRQAKKRGMLTRSQAYRQG